MRVVLVLDEMPEKCEKCPLGNFDKPDCYCFCMGKQATTHRIIGEGTDDYWKPDDCPLRSLPEKRNTISIIETKREAEANGVTVQHQVGFNLGWNACLNEITGGKYES